MAFDDVGDIATQKIGPLPAWGWAAGISGIVLAYAYWRNARKKSSAPTSGVLIDGSATSSGLSGGIPTSSGNVSAPPTAGPLSLDDWTSQALGAAGGVSQTDTLAALNAFMAGQPLSPSQKGTVDSIIGTIGLPPSYSSLPASQNTGGTSSQYQDAISQALSQGLQSIADQNAAYAQANSQAISGLSQQMQAQSTPSNTLNIPKSSSSSSLSKTDALANAQKIAQQTGKSIQTAYGWVAPTGSVTSTDVTRQRVDAARDIARTKNAPVKTAYGWITTTGTRYASQAAAAAAMKKGK